MSEIRIEDQIRFRKIAQTEGLIAEYGLARPPTPNGVNFYLKLHRAPVVVESATPERILRLVELAWEHSPLECQDLLRLSRYNALSKKHEEVWGMQESPRHGINIYEWLQKKGVGAVKKYFVPAQIEDAW